MAVAARDVARALRDRLPGVPTKKLHKLLYYCQGHHLAVFGVPLFVEAISAWDMGPVVGELWREEKTGHVPAGRAELDQAQLNTVGYVVSRYGALTGTDLEHLTHSESPWRLANAQRRPRESTRIKNEWIMEYFRAAGAGASGEDEDEALLDSATVTEWLRDSEERRAQPASRDNLAELQNRLRRLG